MAILKFTRGYDIADKLKTVRANARVPIYPTAWVQSFSLAPSAEAECSARHRYPALLASRTPLDERDRTGALVFYLEHQRLGVWSRPEHRGTLLPVGREGEKPKSFTPKFLMADLLHDRECIS